MSCIVMDNHCEYEAVEDTRPSLQDGSDTVLQLRSNICNFVRFSINLKYFRLVSSQVVFHTVYCMATTVGDVAAPFTCDALWLRSRCRSITQFASNHQLTKWADCNNRTQSYHFD